MSDQLSLRSRVVSLVISALDKISEKLGVEVRLEGSKLVVSADLAGITEAQVKRGPGRPPKTAVPATPEAGPKATRGGKKRGRPSKTAQSAKAAAVDKPATRDFSRDAVLKALNEEKPGFSVAALAKHLGGDKRHKKLVKPVLLKLMKATGDEKVEKVGGRYRLKNLERSAGRPPKGGSSKAGSTAKAKKPAGTTKKPGQMTPARMAALAKAQAANAAKRAAATKRGKKKPAAKKATKPKMAAKIKATKKPGKGKKAANKATKEASGRTDEGGQIPRDETRKPVESTDSAES